MYIKLGKIYGHILYDFTYNYTFLSYNNTVKKE